MMTDVYSLSDANFQHNYLFKLLDSDKIKKIYRGLGLRPSLVNIYIYLLLLTNPMKRPQQIVSL